MIFRSVGSRCAVDLNDPGFWPYRASEIQAHLLRLGFFPLIEDIIDITLHHVGRAVYRRGARMSEAPAVFDCSSFVKWVFGQRGIWLPRRSIQQSLVGETVKPEHRQPGDLVFSDGPRAYFSEQQPDGIGHVAMVVDPNTVVHAINRRRGIAKTPIQRLIEAQDFRSVRRIVPVSAQVVTYVTPPTWEIESSDDVRWVVLGTIAHSHT